MTTTARIAGKTAADTYAASIAAGAVGVFKAKGLGINETILIEGKDAAGTFDQLTYVDAGGNLRAGTLSQQNNSITLNGPVDFNFNKPVTVGLVELVQYT